HRTARGYRRAVRAWVERLHRHGLAVILDLHWSGPDGVPAEGQRAMADERSVAFWASVASRFRTDPAVMFDVFNEPYSRWNCDAPACWDAEVAPVAAQVPVVATEIGDDGCRAGHVARFIDWADRHGVGYLAWEWVLPDGRYSCHGGTAYSLIADTRGTPRPPVGTTVALDLGRLAFSAPTAWLAAR